MIKTDREYLSWPLRKYLTALTASLMWNMSSKTVKIEMSMKRFVLREVTMKPMMPKLRRSSTRTKFGLSRLA